MIAQMLRFGVIGTLTTGIHMLIGTMLLGSGLTAPAANALAFAIAFVVSLTGHLGFTFADQRPDPVRAARRFAIVAATGFLGNETVLFITLQRTDLSATEALCLSTAVAAVATFILSRCWAFHRAVTRPSTAPSVRHP